ncbi:MAG: hypothetical protein KDK51_00765 [Deltaproteobacteria bacterium]|nr:hypothetical protein [Deltaproteobacteria bacterium]
MEQSISNLSSGHFEVNVPNLSPHQINQNNDTDYIEFFLELLIKETSGKLSVTYIAKDSKPCSASLLMDDGFFTLDSIEGPKDGDTVYFFHLSKTYFFFVENTKGCGFQVNTLYQLHRRKWRRYNLEDQGFEISLVGQSDEL